MIVKPSIQFLTQDGDSDLVTAIKKILAGMTGNASYPKAAALLLLVQAALADFEAALANTADHARTSFALKDQKRAALCPLVRSLALDVTDECNGDLTVLLSSGFPIQNPEHYPIGKLPTPGAPVLSLGDYSGELVGNTPPIYGAVTYNWQLALASAPNVIVQEAETTATTVTFADLIAGQTYLLQVNAVGTAGTTDWSPPATLMVV